MLGERDAVEARGARLVFIGNGSPEQARDFRDTHAAGAELYTDPTTATYTALGATRGVGATLGPGAFLSGMRAFRRGHRQGATQGNPWVQGAALVVLPGDQVTYSRLSRHSGDHPPVDELLEAVRAATEPAGR